MNIFRDMAEITSVISIIIGGFSKDIYLLLYGCGLLLVCISDKIDNRKYRNI